MKKYKFDEWVDTGDCHTCTLSHYEYGNKTCDGGDFIINEKGDIIDCKKRVPIINSKTDNKFDNPELLEEE